ncbi:hypothetical protein AVEN_96886-1 [Araneus ventricosus]|uniref:Uncharacterized protein n=1 Tax=Araneus ventricosus TaxID=182803 RepID=A0A4Y2IQX0_ARAVE|nr:hypothetical protein AVEN_96886-1 [Araneus ventricosus]
MEFFRKLLAEVETDEDPDFDNEDNESEDVLEDVFSDHESFCILFGVISCHQNGRSISCFGPNRFKEKRSKMHTLCCDILPPKWSLYIMLWTKSMKGKRSKMHTHWCDILPPKWSLCNMLWIKSMKGKRSKMHIRYSLLH